MTNLKNAGQKEMYRSRLGGPKQGLREVGGIRKPGYFAIELDRTLQLPISYSMMLGAMFDIVTLPNTLSYG